MQKRGGRARRARHRCGSFVCAVLTAYSTWPCAQTLSAQALKLTLLLEVSQPAEFPYPPHAPLPLRLSLDLSAEADLPRVAGPSATLQLALLLRESPAAERARDDKPQAIDIGRGPQPAFYAVRLNRQELGVVALLRMPDGRWYARRTDLEAWRVRSPDAKPVLFGGEEHFPLDAFEGITYQFNEQLQQLDLEIAPRYFVATVIEGESMRVPQPVPPSAGAFVNYDVFFDANSESRRASGLFEAAYFNRLGVGVTSLLAQDVGADPRVVRLDTAWRRDFASEMKTLVIGDAIGSSGVWGRPVRFGGLSYGTNFATNPRFITFPLPGLRGEAALPTTTELYVDGRLRQSSSVPPGPFRIENLPVVTGQGEVRLVVRDLLGREQVISMPYYASSQLLRAGLTEESNEVGVVRNNFGIRSNDYGRAVAAFQRRRGFSDRVTGEARAELLRNQQTGGVGGSVAFPALGVITGAAAVSHSESGNGALALVGIERQVARAVSFGARSQWTTSEFTQLGLQPGQRAPVRVMSGNVGFSPGYGSLGLAYGRQDDRDQPGSEVVSASYSFTISRSAALILFAFKPLTGDRSMAAGITLSMGFGERHSAALSFTSQPHASEGVLQIQKNLPPGPGIGYRFLAAGGARGDREEAGVAWQTDVGTYVLEAGRANHEVGFRANASGALALLGGRPFLSRTLNDAFAVAHVPGFANVGISLNNQTVARTNTAGYALLPRLLPYQANVVALDIGDLPLDTQIEATQLDAVPYFRSGLLLRFPVQPANGALITLVLEDGMPMPVGSIVSFVGKLEQFIVAERGEAYVTGLTEKNRLRATWRDQSCEFNVELKGAQGGQPRVGPIACAGVRR